MVLKAGAGLFHVEPEFACKVIFLQMYALKQAMPRLASHTCCCCAGVRFVRPAAITAPSHGHCLLGNDAHAQRLCKASGSPCPRLPPCSEFPQSPLFGGARVRSRRSQRSPGGTARSSGDCELMRLHIRLWLALLAQLGLKLTPLPMTQRLCTASVFPHFFAEMNNSDPEVILKAIQAEEPLRTLVYLSNWQHVRHQYCQACVRLVMPAAQAGMCRPNAL